MEGAEILVFYTLAITVVLVGVACIAVVIVGQGPSDED